MRPLIIIPRSKSVLQHVAAFRWTDGTARRKLGWAGRRSTHRDTRFQNLMPLRKSPTRSYEIPTMLICIVISNFQYFCGHANTVLYRRCRRKKYEYVHGREDSVSVTALLLSSKPQVFCMQMGISERESSSEWHELERGRERERAVLYKIESGRTNRKQTFFQAQKFAIRPSS